MIEQVNRIGDVQQVVTVGIAEDGGMGPPWNANQERNMQRNNSKQRIPADHRPVYLIQTLQQD